MAKTATRNANTEPTMDDLTEQMAILKDDIAALTSAMGNYSKVKANDAADTVKATAADLKETGQIKALETQERAEEFIRTQPATALGIAAGAGFLIGMLTARR